MVREKPTALHQASLLTVLSILMVYPLPQMAIDIYLPSWPSLTHQFNTTHASLQFSLIIYLFFLGIAQLGYGRLSDKYGRKFILMVGCTIFLVSTFGCLFSQNIETLIFFRIGQALGIGCGFTVASAMLSDLFTGNQLAKYTSYSAMIYALSLIFSPLLGGYIQYYLGWHFNFIFMMIYCAILMVMIYFFTEETLTHKISQTKKFSYFSLCYNHTFNINVLCLILGYGTMVAFNIIAPFLLLTKFNLTAAQYGDYVIYVGLAYFLGSTLNSRLVKRFELKLLKNCGFILMALSGLTLLYLYHSQILSASLSVLLSAVAFFSVGFIYPNCFAKALDEFEEKGLVSAFIGCAILIGVSIVSLIALYYSYEPAKYLSITLLASGILGLILIYLDPFKWRNKLNDATNHRSSDSTA